MKSDILKRNREIQRNKANDLLKTIIPPSDTTEYIITQSGIEWSPKLIHVFTEELCLKIDWLCETFNKQKFTQDDWRDYGDCNYYGSGYYGDNSNYMEFSCWIEDKLSKYYKASFGCCKKWEDVSSKKYAYNYQGLYIGTPYHLSSSRCDYYYDYDFSCMHIRHSACEDEYVIFSLGVDKNGHRDNTLVMFRRYNEWEGEYLFASDNISEHLENIKETYIYYYQNKNISNTPLRDWEISYPYRSGFEDRHLTELEVYNYFNIQKEVEGEEYQINKIEGVLKTNNINNVIFNRFVSWLYNPHEYIHVAKNQLKLL